MAIKTYATDADVTAFLDAVPDERRRAEGHAIRELMERVTGQSGVLWGPTMVGFGAQRYQSKTTSGEMFVVGFSPRKAALTIYGVIDALEPADPLFEKLGPHTTGKGCLYVKRLDAVDPAVLESLVHRGWSNRATTG
jgi:hypothetical protein